MNAVRSIRLTAFAAAALLTVGLLSVPAQAAPVSPNVFGRYLVIARTDGSYAALRDSAAAAGASVVLDLPQVRTFVMTSSDAVRDRVRADARTEGVAADHVESITTADRPTPNLSAPGLRS